MLPKIEELFDLSHTAHAAIFDDATLPWDALEALEDYMEYYFEHEKAVVRTDDSDAAFIGEQVSIGEGTRIEPGAVIKGPAIIGKHCEIRANAYIRENVILGDHCIVGNSTEVKHSILFDRVVAPHFNYIGDSILGYAVHLGAGVILSNQKTPPSEIKISTHYTTYATGLQKLGALLGDHTEIGANSVLTPGSIIGKECTLYPLTIFRGVLGSRQIVKNRQTHDIIARK